MARGVFALLLRRAIDGGRWRAEFCVALASGNGVAMARGKAIDGGELHVTKVAGEDLCS